MIAYTYTNGTAQKLNMLTGPYYRPYRTYNSIQGTYKYGITSGATYPIYYPEYNGTDSDVYYLFPPDTSIGGQAFLTTNNNVITNCTSINTSLSSEVFYKGGFKVYKGRITATQVGIPVIFQSGSVSSTAYYQFPSIQPNNLYTTDKWPGWIPAKINQFKTTYNNPSSFKTLTNRTRAYFHDNKYTYIDDASYDSYYKSVTAGARYTIQIVNNGEPFINNLKTGVLTFACTAGYNVSSSVSYDLIAPEDVICENVDTSTNTITYSFTVPTGCNCVVISWDFPKVPKNSKLASSNIITGTESWHPGEIHLKNNIWN